MNRNKRGLHSVVRFWVKLPVALKQSSNSQLARTHIYGLNSLVLFLSHVMSIKASGTLRTSFNREKKPKTTLPWPISSALPRFFACECKVIPACSSLSRKAHRERKEKGQTGSSPGLCIVMQENRCRERERVYWGTRVSSLNKRST